MDALDDDGERFALEPVWPNRIKDHVVLPVRYTAKVSDAVNDDRHVVQKVDLSVIV